jgi:hypothetical protein
MTPSLYHFAEPRLRRVSTAGRTRPRRGRRRGTGRTGLVPFGIRQVAFYVGVVVAALAHHRPERVVVDLPLAAPRHEHRARGHPVRLRAKFFTLSLSILRQAFKFLSSLASVRRSALLFRRQSFRQFSFSLRQQECRIGIAPLKVRQPGPCLARAQQPGRDQPGDFRSLNPLPPRAPLDTPRRQVVAIRASWMPILRNWVSASARESTPAR